MQSRVRGLKGWVGGRVVGVLLCAWSGTATVAAQAVEASTPQGAAVTSAQPVAPAVAASPAADPAPVAAEVTAPASGRVTFKNGQAGIGMYLVAPTMKVYLCQAECTLELREAPYQVGLALPGDEVLPAGAPIRVGAGPQVVETAYVSRAAERRAGLIVIGVGVALSVATLITGAYMTAVADSPTEETVGLASLSGGAAGLAISSIVGLVLALREDEAHAVLRPADR